ncbi:hypothetical protein BVC93_22460 [Mycobacterium sp. MS1601]|uniref:hypothetical protein n=1 Tax=Mycobacterium sp. MS1601 TaxID=1936029 RepID=UPI00097982A1|nr:hypothetical protein [Mycobacterium sp. MS1601]AQA04726.1 hypothetical protein BVC93_22460 [Mycobacterium sp. MS1601]
MTTPQYTNENHPEAVGPSDRQVDPAFRQPEQTTEFDPALAHPAPTDAPRAESAPVSQNSHESLFSERDLGDLRSRWSDVQASFVDDPRSSVQQADGLVSTAVEQLTAGFSQTRARLEDHWQRGEEASTEDLRVALQRYRDFFDRLLAV